LHITKLDDTCLFQECWARQYAIGAYQTISSYHLHLKMQMHPISESLWYPYKEARRWTECIYVPLNTLLTSLRSRNKPDWIADLHTVPQFRAQLNLYKRRHSTRGTFPLLQYHVWCEHQGNICATQDEMRQLLVELKHLAEASSEYSASYFLNQNYCCSQHKSLTCLRCKLRLRILFLYVCVCVCTLQHAYVSINVCMYVLLLLLLFVDSAHKK
jgi:hypothetical protein